MEALRNFLSLLIIILKFVVFIIFIFGFALVLDVVNSNISYLRINNWTFDQGMNTEIIKEWKIWRNWAYMCYVLIFSGIGILLMMKSRINQEVLPALQKLIPKVIISNLLVTFSYAIGKLISDIIVMIVKI